MAPEESAAERSARFERGMAVMTRTIGSSGRAMIASVQAVSPELAHQVVTWFGDSYARPELGPRDRQLVTIGVLTALGDCAPQLTLHIGAALDAGITESEILEALIHASAYCGVPRALNATFVAQAAFAARSASPAADEGSAPTGPDAKG